MTNINLLSTSFADNMPTLNFLKLSLPFSYNLLLFRSLKKKTRTTVRMSMITMTKGFVKIDNIFDGRFASSTNEDSIPNSNTKARIIIIAVIMTSKIRSVTTVPSTVVNERPVYFFSTPHRATSPARGKRKFAKYPTNTAKKEFRSDTSKPDALINIFHLRALNKLLNNATNTGKNSQKKFAFLIYVICSSQFSPE